MQTVKNKTELEQLIKLQPRLIVVFSAKWCKPCQTLKADVLPNVTEIDWEYVIVDVEDCDDATEDYCIQSVPTMLIFDNGNQQKRLTGSMSWQTLKDTLINL